MPKVWNKHDPLTPPTAVYIGRPSIWGNPFSHLKNTLAQYQVTSRDEAVAKFRQWIYNQPDLIQKARQLLKGRDLVCFCAPKACHGDVLLEVANAN